MTDVFHQALHALQRDDVPTLPEDVQYIRARLTEEDGITRAIDRLEAHLPGQPGSGTKKINRSGVRQYLHWARDANRSVLFPDKDTGEDYLQYLLGRYDPTSSTVLNRLSHARNFYHALHALGHSVPDPFQHVKAPSYDPAAHRDTYSHDELSRMLEHADDAGRALIFLGCHAGLTGPEVVTLKWSEIRWRDEVLIIKKRGVEESDDLHAALRSYAQRQGVVHDLRGTSLFTSRDDPKVFDFEDDTALRSKLYAICAVADVNSRLVKGKDARGWRALRNNAGLRLLDLTNDPELVQERLGLGTLKAVKALLEKNRRLKAVEHLS